MSNYPVNGYQGYPNYPAQAYPRYGYPQNFPPVYLQNYQSITPINIGGPQQPMPYGSMSVGVRMPNVQEVNNVFQQMAALNLHQTNQQISNLEKSVKKVEVNEEVLQSKESSSDECIDFVLSDSDSNDERSELHQEEKADEYEISNERVISSEEEQIDEVDPRMLSFYPIPRNAILDRTYVTYADHGCRFNKDYSVQTWKKFYGTIGKEHVYKRCELFQQLCQFLVDNRDQLKEYKIFKKNVLNQYKATKSYTPEPHGRFNKELVEAHISILPELAVEAKQELFFVNDGVINLRGQNVSLEKMLNLTDRTSKALNDIDALGEAHRRLLAMDLLDEVSRGKTSPKDAARMFAQKYRQTMRCIGTICDKSVNLTAAQQKKIKSIIKEIEEGEKMAYGNNSTYFHKVKQSPESLKYISGILKGIDEFLETLPHVSNGNSME